MTIGRWTLLIAITGAAIVVAFFAVLLLRGGDSGRKTPLVPFDEFKGVPLDTPRPQIERRFGAPLRTEPAGKLDPGTTCLFYPAPADARPATEYEFCFLDGKLHSKFAG